MVGLGPCRHVREQEENEQKNKEEEEEEEEEVVVIMKQPLVLKLRSNADIENVLNLPAHTVRGNNLVACS
jgi:hypothetical protein